MQILSANWKLFNVHNGLLRDLNGEWAELSDLNEQNRNHKMLKYNKMIQFVSVDKQEKETEETIQETNAELAIEPSETIEAVETKLDTIEATAPQVDATEIEDASLNTITASTVAIPSAPVIDDIEEEPSSSTAATAPAQLLHRANVLYPKLADMTINPTVSSKERITLQPFTNEQLKELYHNPELHMADAFENDFINTELNNTHKDHPLHELLKKYSRSRYNLKVNMLDLHAYIKCFQENAQKVWIIENRITSYEGICADGERARKNEVYEYALLNEPTFQKVASTLNNTLQLVCYNFMTNLYACESFRTQVSTAQFDYRRLTFYKHIWISLLDWAINPRTAVTFSILSHTNGHTHCTP